MTRIVICGGPRTGKTTLARDLYRGAVPGFADHGLISSDAIHHTDTVMGISGMDWSGASRFVAYEWFTLPGPWIIEGVAVSRALRKWREAHPGEPPPVDRVIRLTTPHVELTRGQAAMDKGEATVWAEIEDWLLESGVEVEYRAEAAA
jgi:hypothetical protein